MQSISSKKITKSQGGTESGWQSLDIGHTEYPKYKNNISKLFNVKLFNIFINAQLKIIPKIEGL